jgi:hypothetical protein
MDHLIDLLRESIKEEGDKKITMSKLLELCITAEKRIIYEKQQERIESIPIERY